MRILNKTIIEQEINPAKLVGVVEEALSVSGKNEFVISEPVSYRHQNGNPSVSTVFGPDVYSVKQSTPEHDGMLMLFKTINGQPLALIDNSALTTCTKSALAALGIRHLAPENATTLGIMGAGYKGYQVALAADSERDFKQVLIFDISIEKAKNTIEKLHDKLHCQNILLAESGEELTSSSDVIITATNSDIPVLPSDKPVLYGKTYIATGSVWPNSRELPIELFEHLGKCIIDKRNAIKETGDLIEPIINNRFHIDDMIEMRNLITDKDGANLGATRLYKITGNALCELFVAKRICEMAQEKNLGAVVNL